MVSVMFLMFLTLRPDLVLSVPRSQAKFFPAHTGLWLTRTSTCSRLVHTTSERTKQAGRQSCTTCGRNCAGIVGTPAKSVPQVMQLMGRKRKDYCKKRVGRWPGGGGGGRKFRLSDLAPSPTKISRSRVYEKLLFCSIGTNDSPHAIHDFR